MAFEEIMGKIVNHPEYYGGADNVYETIKVIDAWELNFNIGNAVKYLSRAGKKDPDTKIEDLKKAVWYIEHEIEKEEAKPKPVPATTGFREAP